MTLRDCFHTLRADIKPDDRATIILDVAQGTPDVTAVRNILSEAIAEVLSVVDIIELAGGTVQRRSDKITELAALQMRMLATLHQEQMDLKQEKAAVTEEQERIGTTEEVIQNYAEGEPPVDLNDPQEVQAALAAMFFADPVRREVFMGAGVGGFIKGSSPTELMASWEAMQQRAHTLLNQALEHEIRSRLLDERQKTIFYGERRNPRKLSQNIHVKVPWKLKTTGKGDLYIRRHGVNAGMPFRERQSPNDFAITFDKEVLLTDYMFYLMTYLQPKIAELARGTAQKAIRLEDIHSVLANHFIGQELFQSDAGPRLQALHNLTASDLTFADSFGGLAMPSIAVLPADKALSSFGEITLIGKEDLGDPQQVPLFDADAYAVRTPRAQHKPASLEDVRAMADEAAIWSLMIEGSRYVGLPDFIIEYARRRPNAQALVDFMLFDNSAKAWFLNERYGEDPEPTVDDVQPGYIWGWQPQIIKFFEGDLSAENLDSEDPRRIKLMQRAGRAVMKAIQHHHTLATSLGAKDRITESEIERAEKVWALTQRSIAIAGIINDDGTLTLQAYDRLQRDVKLKGSTRINDVDTKTYLDERIWGHGAESEFKAWIDAKVHGLMGEGRIKIGSRWYPYTMENVLRKMRGKLRATETTMPSEGLLRAKAANRIKNLDEARRRALEQIDTPEKVQAARDVSQKMMLDWITALKPWWPYDAGTLRSFSDASDAAREATLFWIQNKDGLSDTEAMIRGLQRAGYVGPITDEIIQQGIDAAAATIANPVPYFEAKPQRAVKLSEFAGAVIPFDAAPEIRATLRKHGVPYIEYLRGDAAARTQALFELQDQISKAGGRTLFQSEIGFTSGLLNAARSLPQEKGTAEQMLSMLKKMPGVKKRELEWIGVPQWMAAKGTVTRDNLINFIESGGLRVEEITLGEVSGKIIRPVDVKAAWESGRFSHIQLMVAEMSDQQAELVKTGNATDITFEMLTDQQVHGFMATLQGEHGTTIGRFGTPEEQAAARMRVDVATAAVSSGQFTMASPEGRAAILEMREAHDAIRTIIPGWGYSDLGDGTYLIRGPEASTWQLAGGKNYREVILKMPTISTPAYDAAKLSVIAAYNDLPKDQKGMLDEHFSASLRPVAGAFLRAFEQFDVIAADFGAAGLGGAPIQRAYELLSALRNESASEFESHVFRDYKNIIAWFRVNDRTGPNGERILFIEEMQSDFDKLARKNGIRNLLAIELMTERLVELNAQSQDLASQRDPITDHILNEPMWHRNRTEADFIARQLAHEENKAPPFAFGGAAWMELVMKRLIRIAAEQGYDQIAWTTGEQQANRYDLRKVVQTISAVGRLTADGADAGRSVSFKMYNNRLMSIGVARDGTIENIERGSPEYWKGKQLEDLIGERLAKQILEADYSQEITDDNLMVGGEGMADFYDDMLINVTNRVARSLDKKARVKKFGGLIEHPDAGHWQITDKRNGWKGQYKTKKAAQKAMNQGGVINFELEYFDALARVEVHALDISDEMKQTALLGLTYFQDKHRASITFDEQGRGIIRMAKARDLSSFLHESAHLWLNIMGDLAERPEAPQKTIDDYAKILKYIGVTRRSEITAKEHEIWAKSQEAYYQEGVAPTHELQPLFSAFSVWLVKIYKHILNYYDGIVLTDEIRGVMDRMVATDEAITNAEAQQGFRPIFSTAAAANMTPEAFEVYRENTEQAHQEAVDQEHRKQLAYVTRQAQAWWQSERDKIEEQVTAEVHGMPVYIALAMLQRGQLPDGSPALSPAPFKISKVSLLRAAAGSQEFLARFPGRGRSAIYSVKGGVDVDVAAGVFGYADAQDMLQALVTARPMDELIQFETDRLMEERFPDPMTDGTLAADALISVHNDKRAQVLAAEMRALRRLQRKDQKIVGAERRAAAREVTEGKAAAKALLPTRVELSIIKKLAQSFMSKLKIREINPNKYRLAEQKAGRRAWAAIEKQDWATAYDEKATQIRNHEAFRAAIRAKEETSRIQKYLRGLEKPVTQRRLGKAGLLDPILAIIEGIDLRRRSLAEVDRNTALQEVAEMVHAGHISMNGEQAGKLFRVVVDDLGNEQVILNEGFGINWQELTVQEFREMRDIVMQLENMPKRSEMAMVNGEEVVLAEVETEIAESVKANNVVVDFGVAEETGKKSFGESIREGVYHSLSVGAISRILDGNAWGALTRLLAIPIRRAYAEKLIPMIHQYQEDVAALYTKHYSNPELADIEKKKTIEGFSEKLSRSDVLSIGLNWGSDTNRAALLGGVRKDIDGNIVGNAFPQAEVMAALATLDARDWLFIQDMWDYLDTYWFDQKDDSGKVIREGLATVEKRRRGVAPQKIEPLPFTINTVDNQEITVKGGYYHLWYNPKFGDKVKADDLNEVARKMGQGLYVSSSTRAGSTYNRVRNHGRVVRLGLGGIDQHLRETIRDIAIGDEINYIMRLLNSEKVRRAFTFTNNEVALKELVLWATDAAVGELPASNIWEKMAGWTRVGFTKSKLAFSITVTLLQITGAFQSMAFIGKKNFMMGFGKFLQNPVGHYNWVMANSKFMHTRYGVMQTYSVEVADSQAFMKSIFGPIPTQFSRNFKLFSSKYFWMIAKAQSLVDVWTWMGAYWNGRNNMALSEVDSRLFADSQVEGAQTSGIWADRSGIERGTLGNRTRQSQYVRLWTTLISYMIRKQGLAYESTQKYKRSDRTIGDAANLAIDYVMLFMVEGIASQLVYGNWPEGDDEEKMDAYNVAAWVGLATLDSMIAGIPFLREISTARYGSGNTPIGSLMKDVFDVIMQVKQGELDEQAITTTISALGTALHLPSSQVNRAIEAYMAEDAAWYEYLIGRRR